MDQPKSFLFLQGPPNGYWSCLGKALLGAGHNVGKINLCLGDSIFWRGDGATNYRGRFKNWAGWLTQYLVENHITDIIYYADQQPYHAAARQVAARLGIKCWAVEFGYLRPDWLTLEQNGMGPLSLFPSGRAEIEKLAHTQPEPDMICRFAHRFLQEAVGEVVFHLLQSFGRPLYPWFRADKTYMPVVDYLGWIPELSRGKKQDRAAQTVENRFANGRQPFWLVALQIHADYQIRSHCPFDHQEEMLAGIFRSFQQNTVKGDLIIKTHPLDNGLENWPKRVARQAQKYGLTGRVHLIKGGDLGRLIKPAQGVILGNSTVGLHSIAAGVPTLTFGKALYDITGLTHQTGLDEFWQNPQKPDTGFFKIYRRALGAIQVKGSFYNRAGQQSAAREMVARLGKPAKGIILPLQPPPEATIIAAQ